MRLKRIYDWGAPKKNWRSDPNAASRTAPLRAPSGEFIVEPILPPVKHVIMETKPPRQHLSERLIFQGEHAGWLSFDGKVVTIKTDKGPVAYRVEETPGRYCCHCGEKLDDDDFTSAAPGELARRHIEKQHKGEPSPDPQNPSGYRCPRYYNCVLVT